MYLKRIIINGFKTFLTPQVLEIDSKITIIIGDNESGKKNLLDAMKSFRLYADSHPEETSKKILNQTTNELQEVSFVFEICEEERMKISEIIPEALISDVLRIDKKGNSIYNYSIILPNEEYSKRLRKEKKALDKDLEKLGKKLKNLNKRISQNSKRLSKFLKNPPSSRLKFEETLKRYERSIRSSEEILKELKRKKKNLMRALAGVASGLKKKEDVILLANYCHLFQILKLLPSIVVFDELEPFPKLIPISELMQHRTSRSRLVANLLKIGLIEDLSILKEHSEKTRFMLRIATEKISELFSRNWKQELLELDFTIEDENLVISIQKNNEDSSSPTVRSNLSPWFSTFFMRLMIEADDNLNGAIVLLNKTLIQINPQEQKVFLRILEKLSDRNQIIYMNHSFCPINHYFPSSIRIIKGDAETGTLIYNTSKSNKNRIGRRSSRIDEKGWQQTLEIY